MAEKGIELKKVIWTLSLGSVGALIGTKGADLEISHVLVGAMLGGAVGFGFGAILQRVTSPLQAKWRMAHWLWTMGLLGAIVGSVEPFRMEALLRGLAGGILVGALLATVHHYVERRQSSS